MVSIVDSVSFADKRTLLPVASSKGRAGPYIRSRPWSAYSVNRDYIIARIQMIDLGIVYGKIVRCLKFSPSKYLEVDAF